MTKEKQQEEINIDKIITNYKNTKYHDTVLAMYWANHLKFSEEYKLKPLSEIIEIALKDVMTGKVSKKEIIEAVEKDEKIKVEREEEKIKERKAKNRKNDK
jgi:hypothetical protein